MTRAATQYTLPQAAKLLGVHYDRVRYAAGYKRVVEPKRIGKAMLFTEKQLGILRTYFALSPEQQRDYSQEVLEWNKSFGEQHTL